MAKYGKDICMDKCATVRYTYKDIKDTDHSGGTWWYEIILRSLTVRMTWLFANFTRFTPNQITIISFIFGILSAYSFLKGTYYYLVIGAMLLELSYILDCIDGRIARLKGMKSKFGAYLDIASDITKYSIITLSLTYGQYLLTGDISIILYGYVFMFLELVFLANMYIIPYHQREFYVDKKCANQKKYIIMKEKFPLIAEFKSRIDPENRLSFIPLSSVEAETIVFIIAPIMMNIKLGIIFGSIILLVNILAQIIFNFLLKNSDKQDSNIQKGDVTKIY